MQTQKCGFPPDMPPRMTEILTQIGITGFFPPQAAALEAGLLSDRNMVLSMPTASGKTLIAEIAMLKTILGKRGNCLYIVPLRALASEKYDEFRERFGQFGIKTGIATGDYDHVDPDLSRFDIIIATAEKVDSLLRHDARLLSTRLACVIADEVHYLGESGRGPTLEIVLTRLLSVNPELRVLGLSATIANAGAIAEWLNAVLVTSSWRPVPLKEGVYCNGEVTFADGSEHIVDFQGIKDETAALAAECVRAQGQVLVFLNTRRTAQSEAKRVAQNITGILDAKDKQDLAQAAKDLLAAAEVTKLSRQLSECVLQGVAFHHAGLTHAHRKIIENAFRLNQIKIICATPTLAVGVNLPSRVTIIRSLYRYVSGAGMRPISIMEYKQMSGRAGRPKYDKFGEAIMFAKTPRERGELFSRFIFADPEPVYSQLASESALRAHLLAACVSGFITSRESAFQFIGRTFFSSQQKHYELNAMVDVILDFLEQEEMIRSESSKFFPTPFGSRISRLYIDPVSAVLIRDYLRKYSPSSPISLLYLINSLPDMNILALAKKDIEKVVPFADKHAEELDIPFFAMDDYSTHLAKVKTLWMINHWMDEEQEETICDFFSIGPGDVHRFVETAEWLAYATIELARLFRIPSGIKPLHRFRTRLRYGIKEELTELVSLRGVGRLRARHLFDRGYRDLKTLEQASVEQLEKVPHIGKEIAASILSQLKKTP